MPLSKKLRFDVFKRDDFTCQYCGRRTPEVVLHVDHIVPKAEGGRDEIENLVAACADCNLGKGARKLATRSELEDLRRRAEILREREEQIRAYNEARDAVRALEDSAINELYNYWFEMQGVSQMPSQYCVGQSFLRGYVRHWGISEIKAAMDNANTKRINTNQRYANPRYFGGIMKWKRAEREGRLVFCKYCQGKIMLDPGEDANLTWFHTNCAPEGERG